MYVALYRGEGDLEPCTEFRRDPAPDYSETRAALNEFLRRVHIATANLAPLGWLAAAVGDPCGLQTMVRVAGFVQWADGRGWTLPPELRAMGNTASAATQDHAGGALGPGKSQVPSHIIEQRTERLRQWLEEKDIPRGQWRELGKLGYSLQSLYDELVDAWLDERTRTNTGPSAGPAPASRARGC